MNLFIGILFGYIIHDAVQSTTIGEVLDKVALPANLFGTIEETTSAS